MGATEYLRKCEDGEKWPHVYFILDFRSEEYFSYAELYKTCGKLTKFYGNVEHI